MVEITYIFGAGASAKCLPLVNTIPDRILNFIDFISQDEFLLDETAFDVWPNETKRRIQNLLITNLQWMHSECNRHASIDTFAKKLFLLKKWDELSRLKRALSVFFILEQFRNPPDNRYDTFYASILTTDTQTFPSNLKILSWNYDYQFEISFSEYSKDNRVVGNTPFPIITKLSENNVNQNTFALIKLNGTAAFIRNNLEYSYFNNFKDDCSLEIVEEVIRNYAAGTNKSHGLNSLLSFAWETDIEKSPTITERAISVTKDSEVLVVIGYSFPFFNRQIDRKIINSMSNLKKVYIQAPDANDLSERFEAVRDKIDFLKIIPRKDVSQFLLPNEL